MHTPRDWARLQDAADHAIVQRSVRASGITSIVWGVIVIGVAMLLTQDFVQLVLGFALLGTGVWMAARPSPAGLIASAVTFFVIGAINLLGTLLTVTSPGSGTPAFAVLGVFQLMWGGRYLAKHRRFRRAFSTPVDASSLQASQDMLKALRAAKPAEASDVIEFTVGGFQPMRGRARLMDDGAIVLLGDGDDVRMVRREQLAFTPRGKALLGGAKVSGRLAERAFEATISNEHLERFERWNRSSTRAAA